jgi:4-hydroxybenzoyl-CoA thioesterase
MPERRAARRRNVGKVFRSDVLVRFAYCDPAKIVFYPRYFEIFNNLVEDWFAQALKLSFAELHAVHGCGVPTVHVETDFFAPSRIGEVLAASLHVKKIGTSSLHLHIALSGPKGDERVRGNVVLVLTDARRNRALRIPDKLRQRIAEYCTA